MQFTHEQARKLIHFASDGGISISQQQLLDSHLTSCMECQQYATSIKNMESILRPLLQRHWSGQPVPLSISMLTSRTYPKTSDSMILATRIAAVSVMFVVFMFSAWQFALSKSISSSPISASVQPIPIPSTSTQVVSTTTQTQKCAEIEYVVHENDTIEDIATRFMVSKDELMTANNMKTKRVQIGMRLTIPDCNYTPTANVLTTTFTPILSPITSTPGG